ncbi:MAG: MaoC family dehydratase N-terminal domain-containing protein [Sphingobium sp.]|nr:MaoC family dehydratase N-terminal domain-containing protein [Sphingobium sp.]MBP6112444.1 MaoC family dehydratase N-terminal domain-containing protein [Sphingobium sp.]MBP8671117.1 MaoC family dehydratase N-terminal domain-containing protein [Sphingobium sp.]MBP9157063.1 MaoC family dehydratase N-terminal domain-containing protein [Sphingobium sp.]
MMNALPDLAELRRWIGKEETVEELLTATLADRFHATLSLDGAAATTGEAAPRLIHFCLCQPTAPMDALGRDGHPARGGFLPPVPLPRRMWAASDIRFHGDLRVGDAVRRRSRITDVVLKQGRTGPLCFVTVDHAFTVGGETRAEDRHIIVYRSEQSDAKPPPPAAPAPAGDTTNVVNPTPTLLFRYSALTFNGHRIHYDAPYATTVEGYPGLVVHGPLQATLLLHMAARLQGREPDIFSFRNQSTLYDSEDMILHSGPVTEGAMPLWTARASGPVAMQAEARWL